jgi:tripartite-type tricarboxylate transporter receptor subunit TctC
MISRRMLTVAASCALAAASFTLPAQAQTTIDKPVRIVVGFPPGGSSDTIARLLADQLRGTYAPSAVVDNKPGASGRLGVMAVKGGDTDGSLILLTPASMLTIYPHVYKKLAYDSVNDFVPVSTVAAVTFAFSVSPAVPATVKTMPEYITWAKANAKDANFGSPATGSTPHFVGAMLAKATGAPLNHIPFKGGAPLISDLLGGQIHAGINVLPEALPHANSGKLRILALSSDKRSRYLPNTPTLAESGYKDTTADEYFAVFVPARTSPEVVNKLNAAIQKALAAKPLVDGLEKLSFEVVGQSPAEFTKIFRSELDKWGPIVKATGFSLEE